MLYERSNVRTSFRRVLSGFVSTLVLSTNSDADGIPFGTFDVPTVFFISKSDDRNRVDYAMRLDPSCDPVTAEPVFPYWRGVERSPPLRTHSLGVFQGVAHGIRQQRGVRPPPAPRPNRLPPHQGHSPTS